MRLGLAGQPVDLGPEPRVVTYSSHPTASVTASLHSEGIAGPWARYLAKVGRSSKASMAHSDHAPGDGRTRIEKEYFTWPSS